MFYDDDTKNEGYYFSALFNEDYNDEYSLLNESKQYEFATVKSKLPEVVELVKKDYRKKISAGKMNLNIGSLNSDEQDALKDIFPEINSASKKSIKNGAKRMIVKASGVSFIIYKNEEYWAKDCIMLFRDEKNVLKYRGVGRYIKKVMKSIKNEGYELDWQSKLLDEEYTVLDEAMEINFSDFKSNLSKVSELIKKAYPKFDFNVGKIVNNDEEKEWFEEHFPETKTTKIFKKSVHNGSKRVMIKAGGITYVAYQKDDLFANDLYCFYLDEDRDAPHYLKVTKFVRKAMKLDDETKNEGFFSSFF